MGWRLFVLVLNDSACSTFDGEDTGDLQDDVYRVSVWAQVTLSCEVTITLGCRPATKLASKLNT